MSGRYGLGGGAPSFRRGQFKGNCKTKENEGHVRGGGIQYSGIRKIREQAC